MPDFAYRVPGNPYEPTRGDWATLVRRTPLRVGDVIEMSMSEITATGEVVIHGTSDTWEVVAIERTDTDGQPAVVRRKGASDAVWHGALVVRPLKARRSTGV